MNARSYSYVARASSSARPPPRSPSSGDTNSLRSTLEGNSNASVTCFRVIVSKSSTNRFRETFRYGGSACSRAARVASHFRSHRSHEN